MLELGRIDYFPRSVVEVRDELSTFPSQPMTVAPGLLLHYPAAVYVFLSPRHERWVAPLSQNLESLVRDGVVARLLHGLFQARLKELDLSRRNVIELVNPLLPPETPVQRKEFWWRPQ